MGIVSHYEHIFFHRSHMSNVILILFKIINSKIPTNLRQLNQNNTHRPSTFETLYSKFKLFSTRLDHSSYFTFIVCELKKFAMEDGIFNMKFFDVFFGFFGTKIFIENCDQSVFLPQILLKKTISFGF